MKIYFAGRVGPRRERILIKLKSRRLASYFSIIDADSGFSAEGDFKLWVEHIRRRNGKSQRTASYKIQTPEF